MRNQKKITHAQPYPETGTFWAGEDLTQNPAKGPAAVFVLLALLLLPIGLLIVARHCH